MQPIGSSQPTREYKYTTEVQFDFAVAEFKINDYLNNAPLIKKLNEDKIQALTTGLLFERKCGEAEGKLKATGNYSGLLEPLPNWPQNSTVKT